MKRLLHRGSLLGERVFDRLFARTGEDRIIEAYIGYATPDHLIARGRVLTALRRNHPLPQQGWWTNFRQMLSLFLTDEVAGVRVYSGQTEAMTDEEGYFQLLLPRDTQAGWVDIPVKIENRDGATGCPVLVAGAQAEFLVISDIDDTLMQTGAYSLLRNLWTSLTGNALTRHVFPDAVELLNSLSAGGRNPIFYVSSSPWNLFNFLTEIFARAGLPRGPMFLRDLGLSETQFITGTHGDHKGAGIDAILAAIPDIPAILIGDTGQHDAFVYRDAVERHPTRIRLVILREPGPGPDAESQAQMREIAALGVSLQSGKTFQGAGSGPTASRDL